MSSPPAGDGNTVGRIRWTAVGFIVGSFLFAIGVPLSMATDLSPTVAGWVFFVGSVFFTAAATLQLITSREPYETAEASTQRRVVMGLALRARDLDWSASAIQWIGTLAFNVTTLRGALVAAGSNDASAELVWRPDAIGSVLFLVSSAVAFLPEVRKRRHDHVRDRSWTIAALNLLGSVFFGLSAVGAYTIPASNELLNARWSNGGTFLGAVCFLVGAALLLPRRSRSRT